MKYLLFIIVLCSCRIIIQPCEVIGRWVTTDNHYKDSIYIEIDNTGIYQEDDNIIFRFAKYNRTDYVFKDNTFLLYQDGRYWTKYRAKMRGEYLIINNFNN